MLGSLLGALAIALAYAAAFLPEPVASAAPWLMAGGTTLMLVSLIVLGTRRRGRRRHRLLVVGIVALGVVLVAGFGAALLLPPESARSPLLLGLPRRAALLIYGIGLLPALFLPLIYALTFEVSVLSKAELAELRRSLNEAGVEHPPA
jgi:MFS family permease